MANVVEFNFVDGKSGKITYTPPGSYVAATGSANCQTGQIATTMVKWRAYFNFNTSSLPDSALVSKVEFLIQTSSSQPGGAPQIYMLKFSIGTFIGAALDGTLAEFNAGSLMVTLGAKPLDNTWLDLNQDSHGPEPYVNLAGDTDIKVWDDSTRGTGDPSWGLNFNGKAKCKLRVIYTIPSATATGHGTAAMSATVRAAGRASASGRGTAQVSAMVRSIGGSTATGRGSARVASTVAASASATAFGCGTAQVGASVLASGSALATGRGEVELVAMIIISSVADATGRGTADIAVSVIISAVVSATGRGDAICEANVTERTASATATGCGLAFCRLTAVHFDPLARHFGTRSVRVGSADARSVSRAHHATRNCRADEMALRGARRLA